VTGGRRSGLIGSDFIHFVQQERGLAWFQLHTPLFHRQEVNVSLNCLTHLWTMHSSSAYIVDRTNCMLNTHCLLRLVLAVNSSTG
jgi:hypothetical protein